ncbi:MULTISPECIES: D-isomer specific 2-hydroxyacid dehydrogenase family protein [unclassified Frankia]|uniref:D-isomer specific 2-hydroxyacid dehydrogenase family protein n=1 Tax=unclassified Frankia TaxID=2632575 RepID=UPI0020245602
MTSVSAPAPHQAEVAEAATETGTGAGAGTGTAEAPGIPAQTTVPRGLLIGVQLPSPWGAPIRQALDGLLVGEPDIEIVDVSAAEGPERRPRVLLTGPGLRVERPPAWFGDVEWVHTVSAGVDSYPSWLLSAPVVTCSRGLHATQISEWVVTALLTGARQNSWVTAPVTAFPRPTPGALLAGSTLGIVGFGEIGQAVARRALALEVDVVALRRRDRPSPVDGVRLLPDLAGLLAVSDAVLLSAAATPDTHHLIDETALRQVRPGVHLLNIARGTLIDQEALRPALDDGRVRLASLDVTDPEPLPADHWLFTHPQVRISPHISGWAPSLEQAIARRFHENLLRYRSGQPLIGLVDPTAGY